MTEAFRERDVNMEAGVDFPPLDFTRASDWQGKPVPERQWLVPDDMPVRDGCARSTTALLHSDARPFSMLTKVVACARSFCLPGNSGPSVSSPISAGCRCATVARRR